VGWYQTPCLMIVGLCLAGCTSDPSAPVNQTFPIRQMDHFFESLSDPPAASDPTAASDPPAAVDYTHRPGYAPAYPPY
jgi:hypothetical protein